MTEIAFLIDEDLLAGSRLLGLDGCHRRQGEDAEDCENFDLRDCHDVLLVMKRQDPDPALLRLSENLRACRGGS